MQVIYTVLYMYVQVHLKKYIYREKVHYYFKTYFKRETFIYFRFITYKVKHLKKMCFNFDD